MGQIIAGDSVVSIGDDRLFAHVRAAVLSLITDYQRPFFVEMGQAGGTRTATLCSPNLPLKLVHSDETGLPDDDNDTWVQALVMKTIATGTLTVFGEEDAENILASSLEALRDPSDVSTEESGDAAIDESSDHQPPPSVSPQIVAGPTVDEIGPRF